MASWVVSIGDDHFLKKLFGFDNIEVLYCFFGEH